MLSSAAFNPPELCLYFNAPAEEQADSLSSALSVLQPIRQPGRGNFSRMNSLWYPVSLELLYLKQMQLALGIFSLPMPQFHPCTMQAMMLLLHEVLHVLNARKPAGIRKWGW